MFLLLCVQLTVDVYPEEDPDLCAHSLFALVLQLLDAMISFTPATVQALHHTQVHSLPYCAAPGLSEARRVQLRAVSSRCACCV